MALRLTTLKGGEQALFLEGGNLEEIAELFGDYYTSRADVNTWGGKLSEGIRINSIRDCYWVKDYEKGVVIIQDNLRKNDILNGFKSYFSNYQKDTVAQLERKISHFDFSKSEEFVDLLVEVSKTQDVNLGVKLCTHYQRMIAKVDSMIELAKKKYGQSSEAKYNTSFARQYNMAVPKNIVTTFYNKVIKKL